MHKQRDKQRNHPVVDGHRTPSGRPLKGTNQSRGVYSEQNWTGQDDRVRHRETQRSRSGWADPRGLGSAVTDRNKFDRTDLNKSDRNKFDQGKNDRGDTRRTSTSRSDSPRQDPGRNRNVFRRGNSSPPPSDATQLPCKIKESCGSCAHVNNDYKINLQRKYRRGLQTLEDAGVLTKARQLPVQSAPRPLGYRSHFKLAVRPIAVEPGIAIGLFRPGTHEVVDLETCPLHTQPLQRLLRDLKSTLSASEIQAYDETKGTGDLRYLAARSAHFTGEIMLTFVVNSGRKHPLERIVRDLRLRGHKINSAHMNINDSKGNKIFGPTTTKLLGAERLRERLCDIDFAISPTAFFQINPWQAEQIYRRVEQLVGQQPGAVAWDLYCGAGQIAMLLARQGFQVLGIEENPQAIDDAKRNARRNELDDKTHFFVRKVEHLRGDLPGWAARPHLITVNPSRGGLGGPASQHLTAVLERQPNCQLIYISCNVQSLAKDLQQLQSSGHRVRQIEAFDMFAQTEGLEWLAVLTR